MPLLWYVTILYDGSTFVWSVCRCRSYIRIRVPLLQAMTRVRLMGWHAHHTECEYVLTEGAEYDHFTPGHGAVDGRLGVEPDHDEPPDGEREGEPHADVVDDHAEVGVEPDEGRPRPRVLLRLGTTLPQVVVHYERDVLHHHQHVRNRNSCYNRK